MISCPNCGKSVADDAVHCGHCGHKIELATNQKTMMGFSLSPEDLQKAIAEAGQQRAAQAAAPVDQEEADGLALTEVLPSVQNNPALSDTLDPDSDVSREAEQLAAASPFASTEAHGFASAQSQSEVAGGFGSSASVHDPFSQQPTSPLAPSASSSPMQQQQPAPMAQFGGGGDAGGEASFIEKNKKMLLIGGAVFAVLMGCCIIGIIVNFIF